MLIVDALDHSAAIAKRARLGYWPREGVIIEWPLKWQFHDVLSDVLTSQKAVSEVVENVGNVVNVIYPFKMVKVPLFLGKITTSNGFMTQKCWETSF